MLILSLDTSTLQSCVGWIEREEGVIVRQASLSAPAGPGHAETLVSRIEMCLELGGHAIRDLDLLVFGRGPGTFTGLRIGLSTVKGICLAEDIPLVGVSSLEALALGTSPPGLVAAIVDARRGELFYGLYQVEARDELPMARPAAPERVDKASTCLEILARETAGQPLTVIGSGVFAYRTQLTRHLGDRARIGSAQEHWIHPVALAAAGLSAYDESGGDDLDSVQPVYLREPDAKLPKPRPL